MIPAWIVLYFLGYVAQLVMFFAWFYRTVHGPPPQGAEGRARLLDPLRRPDYGYQLLLTQRYPSFSDD